MEAESILGDMGLLGGDNDNVDKRSQTAHADTDVGRLKTARDDAERLKTARDDVERLKTALANARRSGHAYSGSRSESDARRRTFRGVDDERDADISVGDMERDMRRVQREEGEFGGREDGVMKRLVGAMKVRFFCLRVHVYMFRKQGCVLEGRIWRHEETCWRHEGALVFFSCVYVCMYCIDKGAFGGREQVL